MTSLAPLLQRFFTDRLLTQEHASQHTIASYRDAWRLLLSYAQQATGTRPWKLDLRQLDATLITAFLRYLENERGNSARTRNARLAAIHSLFRYAALRAPEDADIIGQVLAIDGSRVITTDISWLTRAESQALLGTPDQGTWIGRRDHALLLVLLRTGLRVSELTSLTRADALLNSSGAHIRCLGKGRKERCTPLDQQTVTVLRRWLAENDGPGTGPLFPSSRSGPMSRDAVADRIMLYRKAAARTCPSLTGKPVTPHTLRHSTAMELRRSGVDVSVIALWLGHADIKSTQVYLHADIDAKEQALARTTPPGVPAGRYKPSDPLLSFLESL